MGAGTAISWTDATFNIRWGCYAISPGCDHCYAEAFDHRTGGDHWGAKAEYRELSSKHWQQPLHWARNKRAPDGRPYKVFCGSMCDWADNHGRESERADMWDLIRRTPALRWQLLTKRAGNIRQYLPADWGDGWKHVWLGVSVEDRKHGLPRIDILRDIPASVRFLSVEPLLEDLGTIDLTGIHWVIVGGESGPLARPMNQDWVDDIAIQCAAADVPFFFKQWGGRGRDKGGNLLYGETWQEFPRCYR